MTLIDNAPSDLPVSWNTQQQGQNGDLPFWTTSALAAALTDYSTVSRPAKEAFAELCEKLNLEGIPIDRAMVALHDFHPQIAARSITWQRGTDTEEEAFYRRDIRNREYEDSPVKVIHEGASAVRRRLQGPDAQLDFPILADLKGLGFTDYVAMPLGFSDGSRHFVSWVTCQEGGFESAELGRLYDLLPLICMRIELEHSYMVRRQLLETYLGKNAAERVQAGTIRRNQVEVIDAIILYNDLRGFTRLTDTLPPEDVISMLAEYYQAVAEPIQYFGGDIIKMIGDGMLSIFPLTSGMDDERVNHIACGAVAAVRRAHAALQSIPQERLPDGCPAMRAGFALHAGPVTFGNVGSLDRLDFTVIGPAVNEAARLEELTKTIGVPLLATRAFARLRCNIEVESLGHHRLRDVREPQEVFRVVGVE
ncbi:MAG: adenylate/guanylate cyclase domain-containing protein [Pseudomonadota bacterium]